MIGDERLERPVLTSAVGFRGAIWTVRTDEVDLGAAGVVSRDYVEHPGAVAVIALDDEDRVLLIRQYRHPVRALCWEAPAGLRDVDGEPPVETARRELLEETGYLADAWSLLTEVDTTPGGSSEHLIIYLARGLSPAPGGRPDGAAGEELDLPTAWVPLDEVVDAVLAGRLGNPCLVTGALAASAARSRGWSGLRPV